ncbi:TPA: cell surface protein, partial [Campylobacter fetus]|nr:cell surface protein [Campylobacter fetus]HDX6332624.1 cell surface protein [Campylobacter fetus]HEF4186091.1 cell surface protein [Campylobacter fetus]HEG4796569.1 cell surface protein [Campylobacter fetus]HEG5337210.1 cell surface protein [Campylobacter fetus]
TGNVAIELGKAVQDNKTDVSVQGSDAAEQITYTSAASLTDIKISGDLGAGANTITVTPDTAAADLKTIDLSGLSATGGTLASTITLVAANTAITSVKGSLGADTITVKDENKAVTIDLGKDTAIDKVDVSAVKIADVTTDEKIAEDLVSITNALSGDQIVLKGATSIKDRGDLSNEATLKAALGKLGEGKDGTVVANTAEVFTYKGDTYVIDPAGVNLTTNDTDLMIKLTGIVTFNDTVDTNTITVA